MKKSKAILLALCAVLLVAASVMGTLAYLTSTDTVTNTFTVGKVEITLDETDVDINGVKDGNTRVKENDYKLMPGHEYVKDPVIHVAAGSSDCYLFVKVENGITEIEDQAKTVASQMTANGWAAVEGKPGVYVYAENGNPKVVSTASDKATDVDVFETFTIADDVNDDQFLPSSNGTDPSTNDRRLSRFNGAEIVVTAYAVQADGFTGKDAATIWGDAGFK